jgi:hypothetical protein
MFKRRWIWFGDLVSDEGFHLNYGDRSITYTDERGSFEFGLDGGVLLPNFAQVAGERVALDQQQVDVMIDRVIRGIRSEGNEVKLYSE